MGQLGNRHPNEGFNSEDVQRMMWELWTDTFPATRNLALPS